MWSYLKFIDWSPLNYLLYGEISALHIHNSRIVFEAILMYKSSYLTTGNSFLAISLRQTIY